MRYAGGREGGKEGGPERGRVGTEESLQHYH